MRISDWSSDVCSSDLKRGPCPVALGGPVGAGPRQEQKGVQHFREIAFPAACRSRKYDYYDHKDIFARIDGMSASNWTVAEAKARLSELLEQARSEGPQTITKHGRTAAIIVSPEEWERKTRRTGNLAEFFASSPLRDSDRKSTRM